MQTWIAILARQQALSDGKEEDGAVGNAQYETLGWAAGEYDSPTGNNEPAPTCDEDIDKVIAALKKEREDLPEFSMFGYNNWATIDAQAAGFLKILGLPKGLLDTFSASGRGKIHPNLPRKKHSLGFEWSGKPTVKFTKLGQEVAALLRQHKQAGGMFGTFCWPVAGK